MEITFNTLEELQIVLESSKIESPQFISINNYENAQGEISNYIINLGVDYFKKKQEDTIVLSMMTPEYFDFPEELQPLATEAYNKVLLSFKKNSSNDKSNRTTASKAQSDTYKYLCPNIKQHNETGDVYLTGFRVRKTVLVEGEYGEDRRGNMKKATDIITKHLSTSKYKIFKLEKIRNAKINGKLIISE